MSRTRSKPKALVKAASVDSLPVSRLKLNTMKAVEMFSKALRLQGVEDFYRYSFRDAWPTKRIMSSLPVLTPTAFYSSCGDRRYRSYTNNPMLDGGVSMLQWFFDEVRPDQREVRYWMKYFNQRVDPCKPFAIMFLSEDVFEQEAQDQREKITGSTSRSILETLALSLYFMQQNNMKVILLIGSNQETDSLSQEQALGARKKIYDNMMTLVDKLDENGTKANPLFNCGHLFQTDKHTWILSVNKDQINWLCRRNLMPVIGCIGEESETNRVVPLSVDETVLKLAALTQPLKVLMLNSSGGIKNEDGQRITTIFLPRETELLKFVNQPWWNQNLESRFKKICDVLRVLPKQSSYVIAAAADVLTELLTQRGQGTLFKRVVPVTKYTSMDETVRSGSYSTVGEILPGIIELAFGKKLNPKYWEEMCRDLDSIYLTEDLKSCAVVRNFPTLPGVKYLDKFAVTREERGNFNIDVLWQQIKKDHPSLFWRSRKDNVFNTWYESRSEGIVKLGVWHVFWYGMSRTAIIMALNICEEKPSSFSELANSSIIILPTPQENNELILTSKSVK